MSLFEIAHHDHPDPNKAGNGLLAFPLIHEAIATEKSLYWLMSASEKVGLTFVLEHLKPQVSIEIGTKYGGSLQAISRLSERVYSIDIDPEVPKRLDGLFPNVEFLTGPSDEILPPLLQRIEREGGKLGFALVDGDHSAEWVRKDMDHLLRYKPVVPFYILMHDSFNPPCRLGLRQANWSANKHVHAVELDFVSGVINRAPAVRGELWGGLAMGILLPQEREGPLQITASAEDTFEIATNKLARFFVKSPADQFAAVTATLGSLWRR